MSSPAASDLNRILLGSAIGAGIGLVLLALGVAVLWHAADQRLAEAPPAAVAVVASGVPSGPAGGAASPVAYPAVSPGTKTPAPPAAATARRAEAPLWRSVFDDDEEGPSSGRSTSSLERGLDRAPSPAPSPAPAAAPAPASRSAPGRSAARRPPEAQRQEDSLFF